MLVGIYAVLVAIVLMMWVWSIYLQRDLTVNSITVKVGDTVSWLITGVVVLGLSTIIASNFLPVQVWKIFIFLLMMLAVDGVVLWLTATWVYAVASHKIHQNYRVDNKTREDGYLAFSVLSTVLILGSMIVVNEPIVTILMFLFVPIIVLIERVVTLKKRIKEVNKYDTYTEEEVLQSEQRFRVAVADGVLLKPKENILKKLIKREKARYREMVKASQSEVVSEKMTDIKRKNDSLKKEDKREEDDAK